MLYVYISSKENGMKSLTRTLIPMLLALSLMLTAGISMPAMAADEDHSTQPSSEQTASDGIDDKGSGPAKPEKKEPETALTPAQKEELAILKYGTYTGVNASRIPVITYHNVVTDKQKRSGKNRGSSIVISASKFDKQMYWLRKNGYRTISCEEFYLWYTGRIRLPKKSVLITLDDGLAGVADNAYPILRKYDLKATCFVIGARTLGNKRRYISYGRMKQIQEEYPNLEFQSHTYNLHRFYSSKGSYAKVLNDANRQKAVYGFEYLAYPYGKFTRQMVSAYRDAGIKLAFTYGHYGSGYAKRNQNIYKIKRIKIYGDGSMAEFKKIFR